MAVSSPSADIFHSLFYLYLAIALLIGGLILGWLGYILVKYRAKPGDPKPRDAPKAGVLPAERGHPIWSYVMALLIAGIMFGLAFGTISAVHTLEEPPEDREHLNVIVQGSQFSWRLTYAGEGGIPINNASMWTIPVNTPIVAEVISVDVWHNFALPDFRVRIDAIPGQPNHIWWEATETGIVQPVCVQLCGTGHALMRTTMRIVTQDDFTAYVAEQSALGYAKLEKDGYVVNATYDGGAFAPDTSKVNTSKAYALRITSTAATDGTVEVDGREFEVPAGKTIMVYVPAAPTKKEVSHG